MRSIDTFRQSTCSMHATILDYLCSLRKLGGWTARMRGEKRVLKEKGVELKMFL